MSKYIERIPLGAIERIAIIFGNGRSMAQVKGDADYIMNAGFYDMTTGKPVGQLKAAGKVYAKEEWTSWGYAWNEADMGMEILPYDAAKNYISGVPLLTPWDGLGAKLSYSAEVGGTRQRTAMALDGESLILYCADSPTTPEKLREELFAMGVETALMLDSGGSSQCDFQGKVISSSRRVNNYIAVWLKTERGDVVSSEDGPERGRGEGCEARTSARDEGKPSVANSQSVTTEEGEEPMKKVVLDPGHGGETAGKRSPDGTYLEHEFNLDMAKRLAAQLERHGVGVILTRGTENDVSLADRVGISNLVEPDLFVSLHSNASGDGTSWTEPDGFGIYTSAAGSTAGRNMAANAILARAREAGLTIWGGGLFHDISLYVLKHTVAPAVLIEHGFHTNLREVELLKTSVYRDLLAQVDAKGILDYLGIAWVDEPAEEPPEADSGLVCPHCGGKLKIEKG